MDFARRSAPKNVLSAGKLIAIVSWDSEGVIYIDYLEKSKTVTGLYYAELLGRFDAELQKKRPHLAKKKVLSTMTTHRLTPPPSPRPNWSNCTTTFCPIHSIHQIWPRETLFLFLNLKNHSPDRNLSRKRRSSPPRRPTL